LLCGKKSSVIYFFIQAMIFSMASSSLFIWSA